MKQIIRYYRSAGLSLVYDYIFSNVRKKDTLHFSLNFSTKNTINTYNSSASTRRAYSVIRIVI